MHVNDAKTSEGYIPKVNYVECSKAGFHFGEICNMVCVEPSCLEDLLCCCACIEESHKKHMYSCLRLRTKPLKMVMNEART